MKRILFFIVTTLLLIGCSSDDSSDTNLDNSATLPTIISISPTSAIIGDIITITGTDFNPKEKYKVLFNQLEGQIKEITDTTIKVVIPAGATSGNVTVIVKNESINAGSLTILPAMTSRLFVGNISNILELNVHGSFINTIVNEDFYTLVYSPSTNELIGLLRGTDNFNNFFRKNITTGEVFQTNTTFYGAFIITPEGKLYGYSYDNKIMELNSTDGAVVRTLIQVNTNHKFLQNLVYIPSTNEIVGQLNTGHIPETGNATYNYYKINVNTGTVMQNDFEGYKHMTVTPQGRLFAYKYSGILESNPLDGTVIAKVATTGFDSTHFTYLAQTNEFITQTALYTEPDEDEDSSIDDWAEYICKISAATGAQTWIPISNDNNFYDHFIAANR